MNYLFITLRLICYKKLHYKIGGSVRSQIHRREFGEIFQPCLIT